MKQEDATVFTYSIAALYEKLERRHENNDFFVFDSRHVQGNQMSRKPLRSGHFTFILIKEGQATISLNLLEYNLEANSLFIIPPLIVHEFLHKSQDVEITLMGFTEEFLGNAGLLRKHAAAFGFLARQHDPHFRLSGQEAAVLQSLMVLLQNTNDSSSKHELSGEVLYAGFKMYMLEMAGILQKRRPQEKMKLNRREDLSMSFMKLLTTYFKEERSVQFYAEKLFVTPKHLSKMVKELTGRTCGEFIDEMVVLEAKVLLNDPALSVGNVADQLHFSDQFFFSKFFKHHTGMSPTDYRMNS